MKAYSTATTATAIFDDHGTMSWSLQKFAVGKDLKWERSKDGDDRTEIFVDRATHEFGIIHYNLYSAAAVKKFPDTDDPVFFQAAIALAACWHSKCKKISILYQHLQVDVAFHSAEQARDFLDAFEDATATTQNLSFCTYEHSSITKFRDDGFDMVQDQLTGRVIQPWTEGHVASSEWSTLRHTGQWSDFTIVAGDESFAVHRIRLCQESDYFKAVCDGKFAESSDRSINLPESKTTIDILLDELYGTYNSATGSLFTGFALQSGIEKESVLTNLLDVFIASDKYGLEKLKTKVAKVITDRMPFIHDVLTIVDLAISIFDEQCPRLDRGLRKAIIAQVYSRMPQIINDKEAWQEYTESEAVMKALHMHTFPDAVSTQPHAAVTVPQCLSPPATPTSAKRKRTS